MEIIRGKIPSAKKVTIYGPEGIGKSTFASMFPAPLFIDTEGSTKSMDVARTPSPSSWMMLMEQVMEVRRSPGLCRTLVIDTADWAEHLCITLICDKKKISGIEDIGYGKGYTYVQEEFGRILNLLEEVVKAGVNVVLTAHAKMRKFELPDELGGYDRWEMKLSKQVAPMVKEWADMVLFANYKTFVVNVDGQGAQKGKNKAQGGKRVMYTTHHSCWDAKNRYGLDDEIPFEYEGIRHIIEDQAARTASGKTPEQEQPCMAPPKSRPSTPEPSASHDKSGKEPAKEKETAQSDGIGSMSGGKFSDQFRDIPDDEKTAPAKVDERIPKNLRDLMIANQVDEWDVQAIVEARGYFPSDVLIWNYPKDFVDGCLVAAWDDQVYPLIKKMKEKDGLVFN